MGNSSMMRLKQHLMTIIRSISLIPMHGDKVPCKFLLIAAVRFATQPHPPFYDKVKRPPLHPVPHER